MSALSERLKEIDAQITELQTQRRKVIAEAPRTFEHLPDVRNYRGDRYVLVRADGVAAGGPSYTQRPSAINNSRYRDGLFLYDTRTYEVIDTGSIADQREEVIHRVDWADQS